ncbi:hypothetical protein [Bradyrhizobium tunisiense]|uniref:hypothetical protein n=1 Tax=Bradyrhizobium tunisiense TaxID=3278709 RepID=UPI0035DE3340
MSAIGRLHGKHKTDDEFEKEAQERFEAALRGALKTSPVPLKEEPKVKKAKAKNRKKDTK